MGAIKSKGNVILEYLVKYPELPKQSIARILLNDYPDIFINLENTRGIVRYYTQCNGKKNNEQVKRNNPGFEREKYMYKQPIPPSKSNKWEVFNLTYKKILILSDIHLPFHDVKALEAALSYGDKYKPECILLNGDILDCYALSRFVRDPRLRQFPDEINSINCFFQHLNERFPKVTS